MIAARLTVSVRFAAAFSVFSLLLMNAGVSDAAVSAARNLSKPSQTEDAGTGAASLAQAGKHLHIDGATISEIQRLLAQRGFDPGPPDGSIGPKTTAAITMYQKSEGLSPDGRPSLMLLEHLRGGSPENLSPDGQPVETPGESGKETVEAPEDPLPPPPPPAPQIPLLTDTVWRFFDETGSEFELKFLRDGKIGGVLYDRFWSWQQTGNDLTVTYDNGMGLKVERTGSLTGLDSMSGRASASRGGKWTWSAVRVRDKERTGGTNRPAGSSPPELTGQ